MTGKFRFLIAFLALGCALLSAQTASAVAVSWTVVSSASKIFFDNQIGPGFIFVTPQGLGAQGLPSDTAHYQGTVSGDVTGANLTISSAALDAIVTGSWAPDVNGVPGKADADYGYDFTLNLAAVGGTGTLPDGNAAVRDTAVDLSKASTPVIAGAWDATGVILAFTGASRLDFNEVFFAQAGGLPLAGVGSASLPGVGGLVTVGSTETLTIPILIIDSTSLDLSGIPVVITITGTIVATRVIPEPGTFVMLGIGAAMLVPVAVRRYRRR